MNKKEMCEPAINPTEQPQNIEFSNQELSAILDEIFAPHTVKLPISEFVDVRHLSHLISLAHYPDLSQTTGLACLREKIVPPPPLASTSISRANNTTDTEHHHLSANNKPALDPTQYRRSTFGQHFGSAILLHDPKDLIDSDYTNEMRARYLSQKLPLERDDYQQLNQLLLKLPYLNGNLSDFGIDHFMQAFDTLVANIPLGWKPLVPSQAMHAEAIRSRIKITDQHRCAINRRISTGEIQVYDIRHTPIAELPPTTEVAYITYQTALKYLQECNLLDKRMLQQKQSNQKSQAAESIFSLEQPQLQQASQNRVVDNIDILRLDALVKKTGLKKSTIYNYLNPHHPQYDVTFPKQFKIGGGSISGWNASEINQWLGNQLQGSRDTPSKRVKTNKTTKF